jgi:hypothetical protein
MASLFEQRERAFEAQWAHEEEMRFRLVIRRNALLAGWAASEIGLTKDASDRYVKGVVATGLEKNNRSLIATIAADLVAGGAGRSNLAILRKMDECLKSACRDLEMEPRQPLGQRRSTANP